MLVEFIFLLIAIIMLNHFMTFKTVPPYRMHFSSEIFINYNSIYKAPTIIFHSLYMMQRFQFKAILNYTVSYTSWAGNFLVIKSSPKQPFNS